MHLHWHRDTYTSKADKLYLHKAPYTHVTAATFRGCGIVKAAAVYVDRAHVPGENNLAPKDGLGANELLPPPISFSRVLVRHSPLFALVSPVVQRAGQ